MESTRIKPFGRTLLAAAISSTLAVSVQAEIIISQYVEGSSFNKAIEIANTSNVSVSLDNFILAKSSNGGGNWGKDTTLVRNSDSLMPSAAYQAAQWSALGKDNIDGLGALDAVEPPAEFTCTQEGSEPTFTSIQAIQGEGQSSPFISGYPYITDQEYFVKGVVSAVTTGLTKGFYLQALEDDYNLNTSEGLFVFTDQSSSSLKPGDVVCVKGKVQEYYNLTQLKVENKQWLKQGEQEAPQATAIEILPTDENFEHTLERYEGMLVKTTPELDMRVTRTFGYDYAARRNNMVLAQGRINMQPNQLFAAGSEQAKQQSVGNAQRRLFIESDAKAADGQIPYYPEFGRSDIDQNGSTEDYIRIDDSIIGLEGVLSYGYNEYRLIVTNSLSQENFVRNDPRSEKPDIDEGDLRIATFNVLNYFNSPFGGDANQHGGNRGANNLAEFELQQAKIVNAIVRLDADIVGLMEIENNGFGAGSAIAQLVNQINSQISDKKKHYRFVAIDSNNDGVTDELDSIGTDVITTGVIYREKVVKLTENRVIPMPSQQAPEVLDDKGKVIEDGKNYQRDTLAPTFKVKGGNEKITVAVNHLKSKGSACWEDAAPVEQGGQGGKDLDFQGACEQFRVAAVVALGEALQKIKGHKVILGDMNSYGMEDPMLVLTDYSPEKYGKTIRAARNTYLAGTPQFGDDGALITHNYGYLNAVAIKHPESWSYSFNDEVGALDHLLVSKSLKGKVVDATDWHINGGESTLFDYNSEFKGDLPKYQDHFRASDHDPAVLELNIYGGSFGLGALFSLLGFGMWRRRR